MALKLHCVSGLDRNDDARHSGYRANRHRLTYKNRNKTKEDKMLVGILKEIKAEENRVCMTPAGVEVKSSLSIGKITKPLWPNYKVNYKNNPYVFLRTKHTRI